jgi:16S rRNA (cytosine967-C5)-methyltransferase
VHQGASLDASLATALAPLAGADRRLAHEIAVGVLRHSEPLDHLLAPFVPRGIKALPPALLDVLRIGAYQLRMLDRVPAHAAVATGVSLAREVAGDHVSGFANAVLRRVTALPKGDTAHDDVDDVARLSARWSHPAWLVARWIGHFGVESAERLLRANNSRPPLILQAARGDLLDLAEQFDDAGVANKPAPFGAGLMLASGRPDHLPGYNDGDFFVQDPAQAMVVRFADFDPDAVVVDACAAPGGKTLGLARQTTATVVAADLSKRRLLRLGENIARAGRGNERMIVADAMAPPVREVYAYLLDAPCLGTGTFGRHPDARLRVHPETLFELVALQAALLDAAASRIAPGGVLCYATCSLEPEENEAQVNAFLRRHETFERQPTAVIPAELTTAAGDLQTLPQRDGIDGAYAARLVRVA